ncbi:glycoside hydrolase family 18 protein [Streptomyces sp. N35]|uniref:glycoside hydrolase family 18 protein n=1 Tax=Streptomyces sp. N35 TaxID=2795730 RepID=UPI0018F5D57C|nr:glycoside hydrolase family 18 protein [Streptomyces sp. N35]
MNLRRPRPVILAFAAVLAMTATLIVPAQAADAAGSLRKVGYFSRAATDFSGEDFQIRNLDQNGSAAKLTHLQYAFGDISPSGECHFAAGDAGHDYQKTFDAARSVDGVADQPNQPLAGNFNQIKKLKAKYGLRTSISIGGGSRSRNFSDAASTPESREKFVRSCIDLYIKGNLPQADGLPQGGTGAGVGVFDGIDLDWEYPGSAGNGTVFRKEDKQNFTLLLAEFRRQLDAHGQQTGKYYLLTAALAGSSFRINPGYELPKIFDYLDWAVVMAYDLHGAWETPLKTNHQSALYLNSADPAETARSCDIYLNNFAVGGVDPAQLVLGVPFFSRGWTGVTKAGNGLFQDATAGTTPAADDYRNVKNLTNLGYTRYWDSAAKAAWLFNGSTFWTFDDAQVMAEKAAFVKSKGLGGIGVWAMDGDDDQGSLTAAIDSGLR